MPEPLHVEPMGQLPQDPPQPSAPHSFPEQEVSQVVEPSMSFVLLLSASGAVARTGCPASSLGMPFGEDRSAPPSLVADGAGSAPWPPSR
jgi:hypothetical protein